MPAKPHDRNCTHCGNTYVATRTTSRYCGRSCAMSDRPAPTLPLRACGTCGTFWQPRHDTARYCSRQCHPSRRFGTVPRSTTTRRCDLCGKQFHARRHIDKFCSNTCQQRNEYQQRLRDGRIAAFLESRKGRHSCVVCGESCPGTGGKYCSNTCQAEAEHGPDRTPRTLPRISVADRIAVYERDGWVCQICGDPVNPAARCPELDAPTVDHRVPRARGGEHSMANWQTAHFYCNSVKRDTDLCLMSQGA